MPGKIRKQIILEFQQDESFSESISTELDRTTLAVQDPTAYLSMGLNLKRNQQVPLTQNTAPSKNENQLSKVNSGFEVTSPIIGTAYHAPEPGAKKFVEVGKKIKKGDTVMIIEAMKTMNHVPSTADGVVREICVEDGQPVEFGQTIIILE